jgi:hypothetical protein
MAMAPGERDAVRAQRQAEFEPATRCGCTRPLEPLESHIHRFPARGGGMLRPAGGGCTARRLPHPQPRPAPRLGDRPRPLTQAPLTRALPYSGKPGRNEPGLD